MFNPVRFMRFYIKYIMAIVSILGILFFLSSITELLAYQADTVRGNWDLGLLLLLNMFPGIIVVIVVCWIAARFVKALYGLKSIKDGWDFILFNMLNGRPTFFPFATVKEGIIDGDEAGIPIRIGGPAGLLIANNSAVITEKNGKLARVLGTKRFNDLEPFEKVWDVVDLQPQYQSYQVSAMTREGIPIKCNAEIDFKINGGGKSITSKEPFPMTLEAVFKATTSKWIREADSTEDFRLMIWTRRVIIGDTEGTLRSILAHYSLDDVIEPTGREKIRDQLEQSLKQSVPRLGAEVTRVQLSDIQPEDEVTKQWIELWQTAREKQRKAVETQAKIDRISIESRATIEAQVEILHELARVFEQAGKGVKDPKRREEIRRNIVKFRFIEMIGEVGFHLRSDLIGSLQKLEEHMMKTSPSSTSTSRTSKKP